MFRLLAARKIALSAADVTAGQMILSLGGLAAMAEVRRDLRWLGPEDEHRERELTFLLQALEKRLDYRSPNKVRFLDKII